MRNAERSTPTPPPSPWAFGLADRLDKALKVGKVSNADMADALDVSRNTVTNYTTGRTTPSRLQIKEWAVRTGAPAEWLLTGIDPTPSTDPELRTTDYKAVVSDLAAHRARKAAS